MSYPERILPDCEHVQALRQDLIVKLGLITIGEKTLPEIFEESPYEETLDELRVATEEAIRLGRAEYKGLVIEYEGGGDA